eukprot:scaffold535_cov260-Pinguiococcus_pyrenoidosus.AAC.35
MQRFDGFAGGKEELLRFGVVGVENGHEAREDLLVLHVLNQLQRGHHGGVAQRAIHTLGERYIQQLQRLAAQCGEVGGMLHFQCGPRPLRVVHVQVAVEAAVQGRRQRLQRSACRLVRDGLPVADQRHQAAVQRVRHGRQTQCATGRDVQLPQLAERRLRGYSLGGVHVGVQRIMREGVEHMPIRVVPFHVGHMRREERHRQHFRSDRVEEIARLLRVQHEHACTSLVGRQEPQAVPVAQLGAAQHRTDVRRGYRTAAAAAAAPCNRRRTGPLRSRRPGTSGCVAVPRSTVASPGTRWCRPKPRRSRGVVLHAIVPAHCQRRGPQRHERGLHVHLDGEAAATLGHLRHGHLGETAQVRHARPAAGVYAGHPGQEAVHRPGESGHREDLPVRRPLDLVRQSVRISRSVPRDALALELGELRTRHVQDPHAAVAQGGGAIQSAREG